MRELGEQLTRLKRDVRAGFMTLGDSIEELKQLLDIRRQLMERQLRREITAKHVAFH